jgi:hypothetical protein
MVAGITWRSIAVKKSVLAPVVMSALAGTVQAAGEGPAQLSSTPAACTSLQDFLATDCTLTWYGITLYGAYDIGLGWVSHGLPENNVNYEGESLVNRNGNHSQFLIAPNNLSQTGLGVRVREEVLQGWAVVLNANTGINPQSGQLANAAATNTLNAGLPRGSYSITIDGARAGQPFNDEVYGAHLRSSACARYRYGARLRSGQRRLFLFVHRL